MVPAAGTAEALDGLAVAVAAAERGLPEDRSPRDALPRERRWLACSRVVQDEAQRWIGTQGREGVAPSLLAQLYPALLAHGQRKERGVYFTGAQLAEATARRVLDPLLQASPRTLRITDPAAGGGAFLLAALGRLQHALERRPAELLGMLHGTDLDPTAALLANLALWQAAGDRSIDPWSVRCVQAGDGLAPGHERTFDVVLGNPPWETWQPSRDELRRELGDEAAARRKWHEASAHRASTATGLRARFSHQGSGKLFTYRLFLERSLQLLRDGGRLGLVLPAGLWFDREAAPLRNLLLDGCRWEWLFGFENRARIFPIDTRYRFGVVVAERGAVTTTLRAAFQQHDVAAWAQAAPPHLEFARDTLRTLSPRHGVLPELRDRRDLELLAGMHRTGGSLLDGSAAWFTFRQGDFNMTADAGRFVPAGNEPDAQDLVPLVQGAMIGILDPLAAAHASTQGARARWGARQGAATELAPQYRVRRGDFPRAGQGGPRLVLRALSNATNARTVIPCLLPALPCGNSLVVLEPCKGSGLQPLLACAAGAALLASFTLDWAARQRLAGTNLNRFVLGELPWPQLQEAELVALARLGLQLSAIAPWQGVLWEQARSEGWAHDLEPAIDAAQRREAFVALELIAARAFGLDQDALHWMLRDTQHSTDDLARPAFTRTLDSRGFWRVDRTLPPKARLPAAILAALTFRPARAVASIEQ
ncbi:MAG: hypothetical protein RL148_1439 [Planctomycetota bacterium]